MIDCVSIPTMHCFPENLIAAQHRLRYREVIAKEDWSNIYVAGGMEFDRYDNVATEYFIARESEGQVVGVCRSYPTTIPYMLSDAFPFLAIETLPSSHRIHEASRLVLDRSLLTKDARRPVVDELIVAYMERGLQRRIDAYIGFMLPCIWQSTFLRAGWDVEWLSRWPRRSGSSRSTISIARRPRTVTDMPGTDRACSCASKRSGLRRARGRQNCLSGKEKVDLRRGERR